MKVQLVPIADLKQNLFVRSQLNHEWALKLGVLIETGTKLPPIKITPDMTVIDGRHRIEAHELNGLEEIEAEIVDLTDQAEVIAMGYKANVGGSLPPTAADEECTIAMLLDEGLGQKRIAELLGMHIKIARQLIKDVQSKQARSKLAKAIAAVSEGAVTAAQAAEQYDVQPERLKQALSATRRRVTVIAEVKRRLSTRTRSVAAANGKMFSKLFELLDDGDVTAKQVREIIAQAANGQRAALRATKDWEKRLNAKVGGNAS